MAKGRKARDRKEQKKLDRRRRLDTKQKPNSTPLARQVTPKLADEVDKVYDLIRVRKFAEAEQQLDRLDKRYDRYPAIVEAQLYLYQATEDHERCCQAADRLVKLTPRDPDARRMYAQESMSWASRQRRTVGSRTLDATDAAASFGGGTMSARR